jgi:hypothetical protein
MDPTNHHPTTTCHVACLVWTTYRTCFSNSNLKLPRGMVGVDHMPDIFCVEQIPDISWCGPHTGHILVWTTYRTPGVGGGVWGGRSPPHRPNILWYGPHTGHSWYGTNTGHILVWTTYRTYLGVDPTNHHPTITCHVACLVWTTYRTCFSNSNLKLPRGMFGVDHMPDIFGVDHIPDMLPQSKIATWHVWCGTNIGHSLVWTTYRT